MDYVFSSQIIERYEFYLSLISKVVDKLGVGIKKNEKQTIFGENKHYLYQLCIRLLNLYLIDYKKYLQSTQKISIHLITDFTSLIHINSKNLIS